MPYSDGVDMSPCSGVDGDEDLNTLDFKRIVEAVRTIDENVSIVKEKEKKLEELR